MGRVGGGSPKSPLPSPELSCTGGQGSERGRRRSSRDEQPLPALPGSPLLPTRRGRIFCRRFTSRVFPTPAAPSRRHIPSLVIALVPPSYHAARPASGCLSLDRAPVQAAHWLIPMGERSNGRSESVCKLKAPPWSRTRGGAETLRVREQKKGRRKRKLGGASAPREGAPAASVRSGVAMGRGSGTFERLLGNASARQL